MRIDTICGYNELFFIGLFLFSILMGIVAIWKRIKKKPLNMGG